MTETLTKEPVRRKQLADQLDRLDGIIDALAEALPQAVAESVRAGTRAAVKEALLDVLNDPDLRQRLGVMTPPAAPPEPPIPTPTPPTPRQPSWVVQLIQVVMGWLVTLLGFVASIGTAITTRWHALRTTVAATTGLLNLIVPLRRAAWIGFGWGLAMGVVSYLAPPEFAALLGGVTTAFGVVLLQIGLGLRRHARHSFLI